MPHNVGCPGAGKLVARGGGRDSAAIAGCGGEPEGLLDFLEPNLAFSVEGRTADRVQIRIHFSLESVPPWLQNADAEPDLFQYFVRLEISAEELTRAAESWMLELAKFPER